MSLHADYLTNNVIYNTEHEMENLNVNQNIILDPKSIATEIIDDIFYNAVEISENSLKSKSSEENVETEDPTTDSPNEFIDFSKNYSHEIKNILQNLKCHTIVPRSISNASLEEQITNVIVDIKNLEAAIRVRDQICVEEIDEDTCNEVNNPSKNYVNHKSGVIDMHNDCNNQLRYLFEDDPSDEIILQVINLQPDDDSMINSPQNISFSVYATEMEQIDPNRDDSVMIFEYGDQIQQTSSNEDQAIKMQQNAGETNVQLPVPNPEPEIELKQSENMEKVVRKKKSIGSRIWNFIRRSSKHSAIESVSSVMKQ